MKTFATRDGKNWNLMVNAGVIERVKDATGLNLGNPLAPDTRLAAGLAQPDLLNLLWFDVSAFGSVLVAMLKRQLAAAKVASEDFLEQLDGETNALAFTAFREEWSDFFRNRKEPELATVIAMMWEAVTVQVAASEKEAAESVRKLKTKLNPPTGSPTSTNTPESSESPTLAA